MLVLGQAQTATLIIAEQLQIVTIGMDSNVGIRLRELNLLIHVVLAIGNALY